MFISACKNGEILPPSGNPGDDFLHRGQVGDFLDVSVFVEHLAVRAIMAVPLTGCVFFRIGG